MVTWAASVGGGGGRLFLKLASFAGCLQLLKAEILFNLGVLQHGFFSDVIQALKTSLEAFIRAS